MKTLVLSLIFVCFAQLAFGQVGPLTQAEYVKMLYTLQKNPGGKIDIIEALRKRGIDFAVTDGVRGLTRSKGANDEELKRALEEAGRRRQNPEAAKLPSAKESAEVLEKSRVSTLAALDDMPDFVVKQVIARSEAYAGTGNWKSLDNVIIAVSYSSEKGELYKVLAIDGAPVESEKGSNYSGLSGSTTGGEFVEALSKLFKPESKTEFKILTTDTIRNRNALVFEYEILIQNNKNGGVGFKTPSGQKDFTFTTVPAGEKGKVWVDRKNGRVLRIDSKATDIPADFRVRAFESSIDYDWIDIAGEKFMLPIISDNRFTSAEGNKFFQARNLIRFKNYQRYGSEVKILDDDVAPESEPKKSD
ncbi:MAG: hypothetical protein ACKVRN_06910 [Pyrinomonadaceae bacterium]